MHQTGKGAGHRNLKSPGAVALVAGVLVSTGCSFVLPSGTGRPATQLPVGQGAVRHFNLPRGDINLPLPASRNLVLLLSASGSAPPAVSFRVQSEGELGGDARFTADANRWPAPTHVPGSKPARKVQATLPLGTKMDFWINTGDSSPSGDCLRRTSLAYSSPHAYYFVDIGPAGADAACGGDAGPAPDPALLRGLAAAFEGESPLPGALPIYQTVTSLFGTDFEDAGIDNEPRTFIVISPAVDRFGREKGLLGYFWSRDAQPRGGGALDPRSHSNERDTVFLTNQIFNQKPYTTYGTLAHEFMHLVMYYRRSVVGSVAEETWWDEALAMLTMDRTGYGMRAGNEDIAKDIRSFLMNPGLYSLTQWQGNPNNFAYGLVYLFARYLHDRYGLDFYREVTSATEGGVAALDKVLRRRGSSFDKVYSEFMVAAYTSGTLLEVESQYRFGPDLNMRGSYGAIELDGVRSLKVGNFGQLETVQLRPWGTAFYELGQESMRPWTFAFKVPQALSGSVIGW